MYEYFSDGPFKLPVLNNDIHDDVYALGVYYPKNSYDMDCEQKNGYLNKLIDGLISNKASFINFLSSFFCLHLRTDLNIILTCTPERQFSFGALIEGICRKSPCKIDGSNLFSMLPIVDDDFESLDANIILETKELAGKTVVLFSMFDEVESNSILSVCIAKLLNIDVQLYTICLGKLYDPYVSVTTLYSRYLNYSFGLAIQIMGEAEDSIADSYRKAWKGDGCGYTSTIFGCDFSKHEVWEMCEEISYDDTSGSFASSQVDYRKEIIEQAYYEIRVGHYSVRELSKCTFPKAIAYATYLDSYLARNRRLLLGEHNFSFINALVRKHAHDIPLFPLVAIATEYQTQPNIQAKLDEPRELLFLSRLKNLEEKGAKIFFGIDARIIEQDTHIPKRVRIIHFNFPHDGRSFTYRTLPAMLKTFFQSASEIQWYGDKVLMALAQPADKSKFYQGYYYGIAEASASNGYILVKKRLFDSTRYPGYEHAMTTHNGSALVTEEAREFVFEKTPLTYEEILTKYNYVKVKFYEEWSYLLPDLETVCETNSQASMESFHRPILFSQSGDYVHTDVEDEVSVSAVLEEVVEGFDEALELGQLPTTSILHKI